MKKQAGLVALGAALAIGGNAALADGPQCSKAKLTGISAMHTLPLPDGGTLEGWYGSGHGIAPNTKTGSKPIEGDATCQAETLEGMETACLASWKKAYCQ